MVNILKFGGSSLCSSGAIRNVSKLVITKQKPVVVCSALYGVTDQLVAIVNFSEKKYFKKIKNLTDKLFNTHKHIANNLIQDKIYNEYLYHTIYSNLCPYNGKLNDIINNNNNAKYSKDYIYSMGERLSSEMISTYINSIGVDTECIHGEDLFITNGVLSNSYPLNESITIINNKINPILSVNKIPIITGFFGVSQYGYITTFGRGGSDLTAIYLGSALNAKTINLYKVEISNNKWKNGMVGIVDQDNLLTIPKITYKEANNISCTGRQVLHNKCIKPVINKNINIWIKNTMEPYLKGTLITNDP